jgi:quercetin dioxygenase-like cupin family protein
MNDRYAEVVPGLDPDEGERVDAELAVGDDVLVKAFALGPGGEIPPHEHPESTNVLHVTEGTVAVVVGDEETRVEAPGTVVAARGATHGARNTGDGRAVLTATFAPPP